MKIRTGDLLLIKRTNLESILTEMVDVKAKWSEVGIFDIDILENGDRQVNVFLLTDNGAKRLPYNTVLKMYNPNVVAHREFIYRDRINYVASIKESISQLENEPKENIAITLEEYKGNNPHRTGFTNPELIAKILAKAKIIDYEKGILISNFQEGGVLDKIYGKETLLFPAKNIDPNELLENAKIDVENLIKNYVKHKSEISNDKQNIQEYVRNERQHNNDYSTNGEVYPEQYPSIVSMAKKNNSSIQGNITASNSMIEKAKKDMENRAKYDKKFKPKA